jgi:hypothetical protein
MANHFPRTPDFAQTLQIPDTIFSTGTSESLSPVFFDLQAGDCDENVLVVPLTPFEVVQRLRFSGEDEEPSSDNIRLPLPQSSRQIIPVSATPSRCFTGISDVLHELNACENGNSYRNRGAFLINRGLLAELEGKLDGLRSLRELGFDMACLGEEGDELLSAPWTAFEAECKGRKDE